MALHDDELNMRQQRREELRIKREKEQKALERQKKKERVA